MNHRRIRNTLLILLLLVSLLETSNAQKTMTTPLKQGYDKNPAIELEDMTILPVNLFIRSQPWDGRNLSMQLELKIADQQGEYTTYLGYYEKCNDHLRNSFPKGVGKYLLDMEINNDDVSLVVRPLRFEDEFIIDSKEGRGVTIEHLSIIYAFGSSASLIDYESYPCGFEVNCSFSVSDGHCNDTLRFEHIVYEYRDRQTEIRSTDLIDWNSYRFQIMDSFREPLKMKVSKIKQ